MPDTICECWTIAATSVAVVPTPAHLPETATVGYASIVAISYPQTGKITFVPVVANGSASGATTSPFETISSLNRTMVFDHAKPGKLAATSSGWPTSGGSSVYVGTSSSLSLRDGAAGVSPNNRYGVSPSGTTGPFGAADRDGSTAAAYIPSGQNVSSGASGGTVALSRSVEATGPIYASSIVGSGVINTPKPGTQSLVDFGTIQLNAAHTLQLAIMNRAKDIMNRAKDQTGSDADLTIEGYTIAGADPGSFSVDFLTPGTVIPTGGTLLIPVTVVGTGPGDLTSSLTIFTNEGTALGGAGEAFNYLLDPLVTNGFSTAAPEPASLAVLGTGLAVLAGIRRRRGR